jgi:hypothetical protein
VSGRRSRIVAAQAVLVGVLLVVVYLTLLRPEDGPPLFGVDAPGRELEVTDANEVEPASQGGHASGGREGKPDGGRPDARPAEFAPGGAGAAPETAVGPTDAARPSLGAAPSEGEGGDSPTDDQYVDAVTRLTDRLQAGS